MCTLLKARHRLPAASSVRSALQSLERLELVMQDEAGRWMLADPLFAEWLRTR